MDVLEDICEMFESLTKKNAAKDVGYHFGRERKTIYAYKNGCHVILTPEFISGLKHYGYELRLERIDVE